MELLDVADFLLIAEDAVGIEAGHLALLCDLPRADAALEAAAVRPTLTGAGAALVHALLARPPGPARAERVALACLFELTERNGHRWTGDAGPAGERIRLVTSSEADLARWIGDHLEPVP